MHSSSGTERSSTLRQDSLEEVRRYAFHSLRVETSCVADHDLSKAVGAVLTYFGLTPRSAGEVQGSGRSLDETRCADAENLCPQVSLAFQTQGPSNGVPDEAELAVCHNGVDVWKCGGLLYLQEGTSSAELHPAEGTAHGVIASSPWQYRKGIDGSNGLVLRLGFVNLVIDMLLLLVKRHAFYPLHAAALGHESSGILLVARSDSGKSTQAMGLVRAGWGFLSDDSLVLHPVGAAEAIVALPLRREFGLDEDATRYFPEVTPYWRPYLTGERKRIIDMQALYPERALTRCTPRLLLFPKIMHVQQSRLEPMGKSEALLGLLSQSPLFTGDWESASAHLEVLRKLTLQAPAFKLLAGRDLKEEPELLSQMLLPLLPSLSGEGIP